MKENAVSTGTIREKMFHDLMEKKIFDQAKEYAFEYAENSLSRNVFPTPDALA